jgi:exonuclease III
MAMPTTYPSLLGLNNQLLLRLTCQSQRVEVIAVSYNMSFASQLAGAKKWYPPGASEADFVEQCKRHGRDCYAEALDQLAGIKDVHVLGIQEAEDPELQHKIMSKMKDLDTYYRVGVWNGKLKMYVGALLLWNSKVLGAQDDAVTINLNTDNTDGRACGIVRTTKGVTLIVGHFPWLNEEKDKTKVERLISRHVKDANSNIIVVADTNDAKTMIHSGSPLQIGSHELSQNRTRKELREDLKTCCWHKPNHKDNYGHYTDTGDYVLAKNVIDTKIPFTPLPGNDPSVQELFSDHAPVMATVELDLNLPRAN